MLTLLLALLVLALLMMLLLQQDREMFAELVFDGGVEEEA